MSASIESNGAHRRRASGLGDVGGCPPLVLAGREQLPPIGDPAAVEAVEHRPRPLPELGVGQRFGVALDRLVGELRVCVDRPVNCRQRLGRGQHQRDVAAGQQRPQRLVDLAGKLTQHDLARFHRPGRTVDRTPAAKAGAAQRPAGVGGHPGDRHRDRRQVGRDLDQAHRALRQGQHPAGVGEADRAQQRLDVKPVRDHDDGLQRVGDAEGSHILGCRENRQAARLKPPELVVFRQIVEMLSDLRGLPLVGARRLEPLHRLLCHVLQRDAVAAGVQRDRGRRQVDRHAHLAAIRGQGADVGRCRDIDVQHFANSSITLLSGGTTAPTKNGAGGKPFPRVPRQAAVKSIEICLEAMSRGAAYRPEARACRYWI